MQQLATSLMWIEWGSLQAARGLLRGAAIGLGVIAGALTLGLFSLAGALEALLDTVPVQARSAHKGNGSHH
ncbi:MAG: hypothetical protein ACM3ZT_08800 [Bacillota bacterium]